MCRPRPTQPRLMHRADVVGAERLSCTAMRPGDAGGLQQCLSVRRTLGRRAERAEARPCQASASPTSRLGKHADAEVGKPSESITARPTWPRSHPGRRPDLADDVGVGDPRADAGEKKPRRMPASLISCGTSSRQPSMPNRSHLVSFVSHRLFSSLVSCSLLRSRLLVSLCSRL